MINSGTSRGASRQAVRLRDDDLYRHYALVDQSDNSKFGMPSHSNTRSWRSQSKQLPVTIMPPTDSSPTKTELTKTSESSYSSSTSNVSCISSDSGSSVYYGSSSSSSCGSASYLNLDESIVEATEKKQLPSPLLSPEDLINVLVEVNNMIDEDRSAGFLTKHKSPLLMIEELTDLLCCVNTSEALAVEIQWDTIYNVVHRQDSDHDDMPLEQVEVQDDDSTMSSLSMGSCRLHLERLW